MRASDPDDPQWSDPARERFRAAAATLAELVRQHSQTLLAMTGRQAEIPAIFQAGHQLAQAAAAHRRSSPTPARSPRWAWPMTRTTRTTRTNSPPRATKSRRWRW